MKVTITRVGGEPVKFSEFADKNGLEIEVHERSMPLMRDMRMPEAKRYYASFKRVEVKRGCMLASEFANGATPEEAIRKYAGLLRGELLVHSAMTEDRREIQAPNEWLPEDP